jgi:hypothetical protein
MDSANPEAANHPKRGIAAWKKPKLPATLSTCTFLSFITQKEITIETAKASMERPKPKRAVVARFINEYP